MSFCHSNIFYCWHRHRHSVGSGCCGRSSTSNFTPFTHQYTHTAFCADPDGTNSVAARNSLLVHCGSLQIHYYFLALLLVGSCCCWCSVLPACIHISCDASKKGTEWNGRDGERERDLIRIISFFYPWMPLLPSPGRKNLARVQAYNI